MGTVAVGVKTIQRVNRTAASMTAGNTNRGVLHLRICSVCLILFFHFECQEL